jgi:hypothetical protein
VEGSVDNDFDKVVMHDIFHLGYDEEKEDCNEIGMFGN